MAQMPGKLRISPVWWRPPEADAPSLPVPALGATIQRWLASVAPLLSDADFRSAALAAVEFLTSEGAAALQLALLRDAATARAQRKSYLIDTWNRLAYTTYRLPLPINVSYVLAFDDSVFASADSVASSFVDGPAPYIWRAAALILAAAAARDALYTDTFPPEVGAAGTRLDPSMLRYVFHACRLPRPQDDGVRVYDGVAPHAAPSDVVVVARRGRFYAVSYSAPHDSSARASLADLAARLASVVRDADREAAAVASPARGNGSGPPPFNFAPFGVLTAAHRDVWAAIFPLLFGPAAARRTSHGVGVDADAAEEGDHALAAGASAVQVSNLRSLESIESALAVVALDANDDDYDAPARNTHTTGNKAVRAGVASFTRALLDGSPSNRWYDKAAQFVVSESGSAGFIGEHSHADGMPVAAVLSYIRVALQGAARPTWRGSAAPSDEGRATAAAACLASLTRRADGVARVLPPLHAPFYAPLLLTAPPGDAGAAVRQAVVSAAAAAQTAAAAHDLCVVRARYGSDVPKAARVSPDAWAQLALQLAVRRVTGGSVVPVYEPAHTRAFRWGRTACIRVTSAEAAAWSAAVWEAGGPAGVGTSPTAVGGDRAWLTPPAAARLLNMMRVAGAAHVASARRAAAGNDVDRHLLALRVLRSRSPAGPSADGANPQAPSDASPAAAAAATQTTKDDAVDAFLLHPALAASSTWRVSTSNLTIAGVANWAFGEVVEGGVGVAYSTHATVLSFNIVGEGAAPRRFAAALEWALDDMAAIAARAQTAENARTDGR